MEKLRDQFILNHHLRNPITNEVYCYTAKVGCSYFKTGFIVTYFSQLGEVVKPEEIRRKVHETARDFRVKELDEIYSATVRVQIVRDPWSRLVSAFLDKFINASPTSFSREVLSSLKIERKDLRMHDFVHYLAQSQGLVINEHWMPQVEHQAKGADYELVNLTDVTAHPVSARWAEAAGPVRRNQLGTRVDIPGATQMKVSAIESLLEDTGAWPSSKSFSVPEINHFEERFLARDRDLLVKTSDRFRG